MSDDIDDSIFTLPSPKRPKIASSEARASVASSSHSSRPITSFFPPPSQSRAGITVDVQGQEDKRVVSRIEDVSPPTTPSTKAAAKEKLKGGAKQMNDLLRAIQNSELSETQGRNWKDKVVKRGQVTKYLKGKISDQHDKCKKRSAFDYLRDHNINSQPNKVKEYIDALDTKHGLCLITEGSGYPQLKVPWSTAEVSTSDKKAGKAIGLLQVQTYNLAVILTEVKTDDDLIQALEKTISDAEEARTVGGHLCKRVCLNPKHIRNVSANVNVKFHESCPGMWVVNDQLISFCHCPAGGGVTCMAPGGLFQANNSCIISMKDSIQSVLVNTSNVSL